MSVNTNLQYFKYQKKQNDFKMLNLKKKHQHENVNDILDILESYKTSLTLLNSEKNIMYDVFEFTINGKNQTAIIGKNYRINIDENNQIEFIHLCSFLNYSEIEKIKNKLNGFQYQLELENNMKKSISIKIIIQNVKNLNNLNELILNLEIE